MGRSEIFPYWWTTSETSYDKKTGTYARIDGYAQNEWSWRIEFADKSMVRGKSTSQSGARAACRRAAKKGPPK